MENRFECKYVRDKAVIKEFLQSSFLKNPIIIVFSVISIIAILIDLVYIFFSILFFDISDISRGIVTLICASSILFFIFLRYILELNIFVKRDKENNGGAFPEITVTVTDDGILHRSSSGIEFRLGFNSIKKIKNTKKLIVIITKARQGILFKKDSFTEGTPDELVNFLKAKIKK